MSMAQLCKGSGPFHLEHLLRWGHASQTWTADNRDADVGDASYTFIRSLNLAGESRRLTEMFTHFIQTSVLGLGLDPETVTFGSDGLLTLVTARCAADPGLSPQQVAAELRMHDFPIAIANRLPDGRCEVAGLHYPFQPQSVQAERIVMVFSKEKDESEAALPPPQHIDKAG
jgi:hypothetical protein